ncbi:MAG: DUF1385 domain-containing protein [Thermoleophilia bacterium]|nr:DUF1385 domain-containing protein [Thermoleophilia bacterium]
MMRGKRHWALACRRPDGEISLHSESLNPISDRYRFFKWPVVRGVGALWESLSLGIRALSMSANESLEEEDTEIGRKEMAVSLFIGIVMAIGLFVVLPLVAVGSIRDIFPATWVFVLAEGILRIFILILYIVAISRIKQLRRVFEYHGAEHKTIHALEDGLKLTPENISRFSPVHPRCGTSFLLVVMVIAIVVFSFVGTSPVWWLIASRLIGIPIIVGLGYEVIKYAGKHMHSRVMMTVMLPGLLLQKLTTREPDLPQIEVAIKALEGVVALEPVEVELSGKPDVEVMA